MTGASTKLTAGVETYFAELGRLRASGGATGERSSYGPLAKLLDAVGATLKPKVFCVMEPVNQGAGHPDFGLYTSKQVQKGRPRKGQLPERGVVEVKSPREDTRARAVREQASRYWGRYRLVLVTNLREFDLVGPGAAGSEKRLESYSLADSEAAFAHRLDRSADFHSRVRCRLGRISSPAHCRIGPRSPNRRISPGYSLPTPGTGSRASRRRATRQRSRRCGRRSRKRSASVSRARRARASSTRPWCRPFSMASSPAGCSGHDNRRHRPAGFDWRTAVWHLRAPVLRALFQQLSDPGRLQPLGLVEVLDWTAAALDRVDRPAFFARFNEGEAVPYFYEPFLEAFDPGLRKQLGVWYTPVEVVRYMVTRVDKALKDDLGVADGLAAENVYVLDPCCGTGAYLAEVLRRIASNLERTRARRSRGCKDQSRRRRSGCSASRSCPPPSWSPICKSALPCRTSMRHSPTTGRSAPGYSSPTHLPAGSREPPNPLPFPELEEERDRAERVKQETPILVILGNPPYNGFAGVAVDEEHELLEAYRKPKRVRRHRWRGR